MDVQQSSIVILRTRDRAIQVSRSVCVRSFGPESLPSLAVLGGGAVMNGSWQGAGHTWLLTMAFSIAIILRGGKHCLDSPLSVAIEFTR